MLRRCLDDIVARVAGRRTAIARVRRTRSGYSSWYASDIVTIQLDTGARLKVFLKDYGSYSRPKDGMEQRREREMRVYGDLLAEANLGTAQYYGSVSDASQGRFWLLLEFVEGVPVRYCELEYWITAAGWLGRMQGRFARQINGLSAAGFLIRHDADFFWSKAELAQASLSDTPLAGRFRNLLQGYGRVVDVMVSQPRTLVHGAYRPKEILLNLEPDPPRLCPVDWELAAVGASLYDLALLADGFEPLIQDRFCAAYRDEARAFGLSLPDRAEMSYVMNCFRLHNVMNWLGQSRDRRFPQKKLVRLMNRGEELRSLIL